MKTFRQPPDPGGRILTNREWVRFLADCGSKPVEELKQWAATCPEKKLFMKNEEGWSIAHEFMVRNLLSDSRLSFRVLSLRDSKGTSVAHIMASAGTLLKKLPVLPCKDRLLDILVLGLEDTVIIDDPANHNEKNEHFLSNQISESWGRGQMTVAHVLADHADPDFAPLLTEEILGISAALHGTKDLVTVLDVLVSGLKNVRKDRKKYTRDFMLRVSFQVLELFRETVAYKNSRIPWNKVFRESVNEALALRDAWDVGDALLDTGLSDDDRDDLYGMERELP